MSQILLVEDERHTLKILASILRTEGYKVASVSGSEKAAGSATAGPIAVMVVDVSKFSRQDIERLHTVQQAKKNVSLIVISDKNQDVSPLDSSGSFVHITKPFRMEDLVVKIQQASDYNEKALAEMENLQFQVETSYQFRNVVAESAVMKSICELVSRIAPTDVNVFITGELGAGKSLLARAVHESSRRSAGKCMEVNCADQSAAVSTLLFGEGNTAGAFEAAKGGTVILANVDRLGTDVQPVLLKTLQDRRVSKAGKDVPIDVRVVSTAINPDGAVAAGKLLPALFKQLKAISIIIPPLRDRRDDIPALVEKAARDQAVGGKKRPAIDQEAMDILVRYNWPRNGDELEKAVQDAVAAAKDGRITPATLPASVKT